MKIHTVHRRPAVRPGAALLQLGIGLEQGVAAAALIVAVIMLAR